MKFATQNSLFEDFHPECDSPSLENINNWLGLVIGHRQLFQALEFDYLLLDSQRGTRIGINSYALNHEQNAPEHNIQVFIKISPSLLPNVSFSRPCSSLEPTIPLREVLGRGGVIAWAYVLPVSTFVEISVEDSEQLNRLVGLTRLAANISLPCSPSVNPNLKSIVSIESPFLEYRRETVDSLRIIDSYRGAVTMALWGIPRVVPWIQSLLQSLSKDGPSSLAPHPAIPGWMRSLPWDKKAIPGNGNSDDLEICLWNTIIRELSKCAGSHEFDPSKFIENCANSLSTSSRFHSQDYGTTLDYVFEQTQLMLSGRAGIDIEDRRVPRIGLALQLFMLRPKPDQYKTWFLDYPDLSLPAWVAGLIFCGLLSGYHLLPCEYRNASSLKPRTNSSRFRDLLLFHFLSCEATGNSDESWPGTPVETPKVVLEGSDLVLSWDNIIFSVKNSSERMAWLDADFSDPEILDKAKRIARLLRWSCTTRFLLFPPGCYRVDGAMIAVDGTSAGQQHVVSDCDFRIQISDSVASEEFLDIELFRHHLIAEGGDFKQRDVKVLTPAMEMRGTHGGHGSYISNSIHHASIQIKEIPGLSIIHDFISPAEENVLLDRIESGCWSYVGSKSSSRRVQHFGWTYNYKSRSVKPSDRIGALPEWAESLAQRLYREQLMPYVADQLIINEYTSGQGISAHTDSPGSFRETIVSISLLDSWTMRFSRSLKGGPFHEVLLPSRSALVMSGESRSSWLHGIRKRKTDESGRPRIRRVSLTFRRVISPSGFSPHA